VLVAGIGLVALHPHGPRFKMWVSQIALFVIPTDTNSEKD
jgi:hypothetical protein